MPRRVEAVGDGEARAVALREPIEQRLPGLGLALGQGRRLGRAVADEIGGGVGGDLGHRFIADPALAHAVDGRVQHLGQRH